MIKFKTDQRYFLFLSFKKSFSSEINVSVEIYAIMTVSVLLFVRKEKRTGLCLLFEKENTLELKIAKQSIASLFKYMTIENI